MTITTDDKNNTFIIEDSGLGMSREELASNLGTIARSGSKSFVDEVAAAEGGTEGAAAAAAGTDTRSLLSSIERFSWDRGCA